MLQIIENDQLYDYIIEFIKERIKCYDKYIDRSYYYAIIEVILKF